MKQIQQRARERESICLHTKSSVLLLSACFFFLWKSNDGWRIIAGALASTTVLKPHTHTQAHIQIYKCTAQASERNQTQHTHSLSLSSFSHTVGTSGRPSAREATRCVCVCDQWKSFPFAFSQCNSCSLCGGNWIYCILQRPVEKYDARVICVTKQPEQRASEKTHGMTKTHRRSTKKNGND